MGFNPRLPPRNGIEDPGHAVRDVVFHPIFDEEHGHGDPDHGIEKIEDIGDFDIGPGGESLFDEVDTTAQQMSGDAGGDTDDHGKDHDELSFGEPLGEARKPAVECFGGFQGEDLLFRSIPSPPGDFDYAGFPLFEGRDGIIRG